MRRIVIFIALLISCFPVGGQEILRASKVHAIGGKNIPSVGLPLRHDDTMDNVVTYRDGFWEGKDSLNSTALWTMTRIKPGDKPHPRQPKLYILAPIFDFCLAWAEEKPKGPADIVYGPFGDGWFVTVCKKTSVDLGWKSIGFVVPSGGMDSESTVYAYSHCVNWIENKIPYNLYPKLPAHLQEIIEEMTSCELLCPFQEFEAPEVELPDPEINYDWEDDSREIM